MLAILRANTRLPESLWGDLNGQLAALDLGAKRLHGLLDEYGDALVLQAMGELRSRALKLMRSHIASLPDGRYSFEDVLDNDGITPEPLTIALDMTVAGDRLLLDFSRSSPQCAGPVNISRATAVAACYVALKHLFPDVPANAGVLDAVDFEIPDRLVISAERPRPMGGYTETILRMIDVIFSAAAQADPKRAVAQAYGTINALSIAGHRSDAGREGQRWVMFSFFGGGHGGAFGRRWAVARQRADLHRDHSAAGDPRSRLPGALHRMVAARRFGRRRPAPRRPGRGLRDRAAGEGRRGLRLRRARQLAAQGHRGRRPGRAQRLSLRERGRLARAADGVEDARHPARARRARAPGDAGRRRLGRAGRAPRPSSANGTGPWAT